jgi:hypothetical protein
MRRFVPFLLVLVMAAVIGIFLALWQTKPPTDRVSPDPNAGEVTDTKPEEVRHPEGTNDTTTPPPVVGEVPGPAEPQVTDANWEERLDDILVDDKIDTDVKADKIADMIPKLSEPAQKELAEHLVNLVSDEQYQKAADILKNEKIPASVSQVLLDDLFNRDHSLALPLFLEVAQNDKHGLKDEAKEMLEMVVMEDYGTNWVKWREAVDELIKEQNGIEQPAGANP